ncbi:MAG: YihY/virulence factor BrkB family protein [Clostridiales bacterium]|nr:YihY/virulence factor BrkB family protein [Clostridiales bacterium]
MARVRKFLNFVFGFVRKFEENELIYFANALTYRLLLAMFPFIIFLMTLFGFLDLEVGGYIKRIAVAMPSDVREILFVFLEEVVYSKNVSLLSISLLLSVFSASSGFNYLIKGINKAFDIEDERNFIKKRVISILLVFVFSFLITASLILFIFCDAIEKVLIDFIGVSDIIKGVFGMTGYIINVIALFGILIVIFKISVYKKTKLRQLAPGTLIVVCGWLMMSKIFNIYVNNFSKISVIYGSLGSIFILLVWLNILSVLILAGNQINAMLIESKKCYENDS